MVRRDLDAESAASRIATLVVEALRRNLTLYLRPLGKQESKRFPQFRGVILDTDIAALVEKQMELSNLRIERVLFVLSTYGRQDLYNRAGWASARDVLDWIHQMFPRVTTDIPSMSRPPDSHTWSPPAKIQLPTFVIKKTQRNDSHAKFDEEQFIASIHKALVGRGDAAMKSRSIAAWVLQGIEGQSTIHSGQLAVGVLDCLRRVDDLAYLRWATILKQIRSVRQFSEEARELIISPSPRLVFDLRRSEPIDRFAPAV